MGLFATKSLKDIISESEGGKYRLKKTLGPAQLVALGIGAIILKKAVSWWHRRADRCFR